MTLSETDTTGLSRGVVKPTPDASPAVDDSDVELPVLKASGSDDPAAKGADPGAGRADAASTPADPTPPADRRKRTLTWADLSAVITLVALALFIVSPLWFQLDHELLEDPQDQAFFEWMMAHGARVVTDFAYPFVSDRMNAPNGVNMMANTSVLAISVPMTPVTLAFGPHVAFNTFLTLALTATALSWYFTLSRCFLRSRAASWVAALFASFAPSMVSHAGGHPNIVSQFLIPLIIWRTVRLRERGHPVRNGLLLALFLVWQAFINLEVLFMTAVGLGVFCLIMVVGRAEYRRDAWPFLKALAVAAAVTVVALAYPLYIQFRGPYAYEGLPISVRAYGADLGSFVAYARQSLAGDAASASRLAQNAAEENAFFGWGMVILFFALLGWLHRNVVVVGLGVVALLFAVLSLGPSVYLNGTYTGVQSLWDVLQHLPVLHSAVPTRWALAIAPVLAILLALAVERCRELAIAHPDARGPIRFATISVLAMALVPLFPEPLLTRPMAPVPDFVTSGAWRQYVDDRHTAVTLPLPDNSYPDPLRWSAFTGHDMRIPRGYFLAPAEDPNNPENRTALFTAPYRSTSAFFAQVRAGRSVRIDNSRRRITLVDLRYWNAAIVVLAPQPRDFELRHTMSEILGFQPQWIKGVWVWDVRRLVDDERATLVDPPQPPPANRRR